MPRTSGTAVRVCAYCEGAGKDPFGVPSKLSACAVCLGRGKVRVPRAAEACPSCEGSGQFAAHRLPCSVCKGKGAVGVVHGHKRERAPDGEAREGLQKGTGLPPISSYTFTAMDKGIRGKRRRLR